MPLRAALLALLLALLLVTACGAEPPATCGAPGLVRACACVGGAQGAQGMQGRGLVL